MERTVTLIKRIISRPARGDDGFAMYITVIICMILFMISGSALEITASNLANSRHSNDVFAAQSGAEAGANEFFSELNHDPYIYNDAGTTTTALNSIIGVNANTSAYWAEINGGQPQPCTNAVEQVCYHVTVTPSSSTLGSDHGILVATAQAVTGCRVRVPTSSPNPPGCVASTVEQRLQQRNFFDYLYFDDYETLDPALYPATTTIPGTLTEAQAVAGCETYATGRNATCTPAVFLGTDTGSPTTFQNVYAETISGPIHTNDSTFYYCGYPIFDTTAYTNLEASYAVESNGAGPLTAATNAGVGTSCNPNGSGVIPRGLAANSNAGIYAFPNPTPATLANIANPNDRYPKAGASGPDTYITLNGSAGAGTVTQANTYSVTYGDTNGHPAAGTPTSTPWPSTGVIYAAGDVYIEGQACLPVSIVATGSIYIDGNLIRQTGCSGSIGLEADNAVVVASHDRANSHGSYTPVGAAASTCAGALPSDPADPSRTLVLVNTCENRYIDAAVLALGVNELGGANPAPPGGSFYVQDWDSAPVTTSAQQHQLVLDGAVAARYRGAYGAYDVLNGTFTSGWLKAFTFDQTLQNIQPPYFLTPVNAGWARTDETPVPNQ